MIRELWRTVEWFGELNPILKTAQCAYSQTHLLNSTPQPPKLKSNYAPIKLNYDPSHLLPRYTQTFLGLAKFGFLTNVALKDDINHSIIGKITSFRTNVGYLDFTKLEKQHARITTQF